MLFLGNSVIAKEVTTESTGTDVHAGVIVESTGVVRFIVREEKTLIPIEGAAIEIYEESQKDYVFYGLTESSGIYTMEVGYPTIVGDGDVVEEKNGRMSVLADLSTHQGDLLKWQVYKKDYLPYPKTGEFQMSKVTTPHDVEVYLHKLTSKNPENPKNPKNPEDSKDPGKKEGPKTGIEMKWQFLIGGLILMGSAMGLLIIIKKKDKIEDAEK